MNFIVGWIMRLCELRDAIARGQATGAMLIPNFISSLRARFNDERDDEGDTTRAEYALIVAVLAVVVIAAYRAFGGGNPGSPM